MRLALAVATIVVLASAAAAEVVTMPALASAAPSFSGVGVLRDCVAHPDTFIPFGFLDGANGMTVNLDIDPPSGDQYETQSSFVPDSDHFALTAAETMQYLSDRNPKPLYSAGFTAQITLLDSSRNPVSPAVIASVQVPLCPGRSRTDFDGNGTDDLVVFRPSTGTWWVRAQHPAPYDDHVSNLAVAWGKNGDVPVAADYDGDGLADYAVYRPSNCTWYIRHGGPKVQWGKPGDLPFPADYNGDGRVDLAVWRPSTGSWYIRGIARIRWGTTGDLPSPADYDGDASTDPAVFRPSNHTFYVDIDGSPTYAFGKKGDIPVSGNYYDGDGTDDPALYEPNNGFLVWDNIASSVSWGQDGDIVTPMDGTGRGWTQSTVFRPSNGDWYLDGGGRFHWGESGDIPIHPLA
jgi:hypothetical protein